jgi:hypothetical protein
VAKWQTRKLEVLVGKPVEVRVLSSAVFSKLPVRNANQAFSGLERRSNADRDSDCFLPKASGRAPQAQSSRAQFFAKARFRAFFRFKTISLP